MPPRRPSKKDSPAKLAGRMKRRWRVVRLRNKGEILGQVEAPDVASAKAAAVVQFDLDEIQRDRIMVAGACPDGRVTSDARLANMWTKLAIELENRASHGGGRRSQTSLSADAAQTR